MGGKQIFCILRFSEVYKLISHGLVTRCNRRITDSEFSDVLLFTESHGLVTRCNLVLLNYGLLYRIQHIVADKSWKCFLYSMRLWDTSSLNQITNDYLYFYKKKHVRLVLIKRKRRMLQFTHATHSYVHLSLSEWWINKYGSNHNISFNFCSHGLAMKDKGDWLLFSPIYFLQSEEKAFWWHVLINTLKNENMGLYP